MANTLQIKRSTTAGNVPQLAAGELGANLPDNTLYVGQDANTKLLIHSDNADGSTTFKDASPSGHTITTYGNPAHSTAQAKFGASSIHQDSSTDSFGVATAHSDFALGTQDWTLDFWWYPDGDITDVYFLHTIGTYQMLCLYYHGSGGFKVLHSNPSSWQYPVQGGAGTIQSGQWQHIAFVRAGDVYTVYLNGSVVAGPSTDTAALTGATATVNANSAYVKGNFEGFVDEYRLSVGIARWTAAFTPPTRRYGVMSPEPTGDHLPLSGGTLSGALTVEGNIQIPYGGMLSTPHGASRGIILSGTGNNDFWSGYGDKIFSAYDEAAGVYAENFRITSAGSIGNNLTVEGSTKLTGGLVTGNTIDGKPDAHTKLLIHSDTHDGSTTFTDASGSGHTFSKYGNLQHKIAQKVFGSSSMYFDGSGDYLTAPHSSDHDFGSGDFTVDAWVRMNNGWTHAVIVGQDADNTGVRGWHFRVGTNATLLFRYSTTGSNEVDKTSSATGIVYGQWYHVAFVRSGNTYAFYVNGVQKGTGSITETLYSSGTNTLRVGMRNSDLYFNGYMDELRVSNGIARWTAAFTPPTRPYSYVDLNSNLNVAGYLEAPNIDGKPDSYTKLLIHSDTTDGRGTFTDSSPSGHAITASGNTRHETDYSKFGATSIFIPNATSDTVNIPLHSDFEFTGDFTIDMWVNVPSGGDRSLYVQSDSSTYLAFNYSKSATQFNLYINGGGASQTPSYDLVGWNHVAWIRSGNQLVLYVNGTAINTVTNSATLGYAAGNQTINRLGGGAATTPHYCDEVRISKGIARWKSGFTPPTRPYATFSAGDGVFTGELLTPRLGVGAFNTGNVDYEFNVEGTGRFSDGLIAVNGITATGNFNLSGGGSTSLSGTLGVTGAATFSAATTVNGALAVNSTGTALAVSGNITGGGTAIFTGDLTCSDDLYLNATNAWIIAGRVGNALTGGILRIQNFGHLRVDGSISTGGTHSVSGSTTGLEVGTGTTVEDNSIRVSTYAGGNPMLEFANADSATHSVSKVKFVHTTTNSWYRGNLQLWINNDTDGDDAVAADLHCTFFATGSTTFNGNLHAPYWAGNLLPSSNGSYTLGNASYRWSSLHSGTGDFTGVLTAGTTNYQIQTTHSAGNDSAIIMRADNADNKHLEFRAKNANYNQLFLSTTGRVGIGDSGPDYTLDVAGTFRATGAGIFGGALTVGGDTEITTASTTLLTIQGASSGYVNAGIVLKCTSDSHYRGSGVFMHDAGGDTEWYAGRPYASSDKYIIGRKASQASHDDAVAQAANALFTISSTGAATFGDTLTVGGWLYVNAQSQMATNRNALTDPTSGIILQLKNTNTADNVYNTLMFKDAQGNDAACLTTRHTDHGNNKASIGLWTRDGGNVTERMTIAPGGAATFSGALTVAGAASFNTIGSNLVGAISTLFDLGTASLKWRNLNMSGTATIGGGVSVTGSSSFQGADFSSGITGTSATFTGVVTADAGLHVEGVPVTTGGGDVAALLTIDNAAANANGNQAGIIFNTNNGGTANAFITAEQDANAHGTLHFGGYNGNSTRATTMSVDAGSGNVTIGSLLISPGSSDTLYKAGGVFGLRSLDSVNLMPGGSTQFKVESSGLATFTGNQDHGGNRIVNSSTVQRLQDGTCYIFDGSTGSIRLTGSGGLPSSNLLNTWAGATTIAMWIKPNGVPAAWDGLYSNAVGGAGTSFCFGVSGVLRIASDSGNPQVNSTAAVTANEWNHVVASYSGSAITFYINGVAAGGGGSYTPQSNNSTTDFTIGQYYGGAEQAQYKFDGQIRQLQHFGSALSATEVGQLYSGENPKKNTSNLVVNGDFSNALGSEWVEGSNTTMSLSNGRLRIDSDNTSMAYAYQAVSVVIGKRYLLKYDNILGNGASVMRVGNGANGTTYRNNWTQGTNLTFFFTPTASTIYLTVGNNSANAAYYSFHDNISLVSADTLVDLTSRSASPTTWWNSAIPHLYHGTRELRSGCVLSAGSTDHHVGGDLRIQGTLGVGLARDAHLGGSADQVVIPREQSYSSENYNGTGTTKLIGLFSDRCKVSPDGAFTIMAGTVSFGNNWSDYGGTNVVATMANNKYFAAINSTPNANVRMIGVNTSNQVSIAPDGGETAFGGNTQLPNGNQVQWAGASNAIFGHGTNNYVAIKTNGVDRLKIDSGGTHNLYGNSIVNSASVQGIQDGACYDFDGTDDYIDLDTLAISLTSVTQGAISAWVKPTDATPSANMSIVSITDLSANTAIFFRCENDGSLNARIHIGGTAPWAVDTDGVVFADNTWTHVALVQNGTAPVLYVDGVAVAQTVTNPNNADSTKWWDDLTGLDSVRVGAMSYAGNGNSLFWKGQIRDVKIFPSALDAPDIRKLYSGENPKKNLGGELVINGTFADLTGWTSNVSGTSTITYQNNKAKLNDRVSSACDLQNTAAIPTVSGKWYLARATFGGDRSNNGGTGSWFKWSIGHGSGWTYHDPGYGADGTGGSRGGDRFAYFKATATTAYIKFTNGNDAGYVTVEKVSIQEVGTMVDLNPQSVSPTIWNNEANLMLNGTVVGASASGGNSAWGNITQDRYGDVSFPSKVRIGDVSESMFGNQYPLVVKESGMSYILLDGSDDSKAGIVYRTDVAGSCGNKEWVIGSTPWQDNDGDLRFTWHSPCVSTAHVLRLTQGGSAIFGGPLSATTGAFSGALTGTTGTFSGVVTGAVIDGKVRGVDSSTNGTKFLELEHSMSADPSYYKLLLPAESNGNNGGYVKLTVIWQASHAGSSHTQVVEFTYSTNHTGALFGFLQVDHVAYTNVSDTYSSYGGYQITPTLKLYRGVVEDGNGDCGVLIQLGGKNSYNTARTLRAEITGKNSNGANTLTYFGTSNEAGAVALTARTNIGGQDHGADGMYVGIGTGSKNQWGVNNQPDMPLTVVTAEADKGINLKNSAGTELITMRQDAGDAAAIFLRDGGTVMTRLTSRSDESSYFAGSGLGIGTAGSIGTHKLYVNGTTHLVGALTGTSATFSHTVDPGTTPTALSVVLPGVSAGTVANQYAIKVHALGYNNSSNVYGVHSTTPQQNISPAFAYYGETSGVYGDVYGIYTRATQSNLNGGCTAYAVYGSATSTVSSYTVGKTYGGYFTNTSSVGAAAVGLYVSSSYGNPLIVNTGTTQRLIVKNNGNTGIGGDPGTYRLYVNGGAKVALDLELVGGLDMSAGGDFYDKDFETGTAGQVLHSAGDGNGVYWGTDDTGGGGGSGDITSVIGGNAIDVSGGTSGDATVNHADTSTQATVNNSNNYVVQDITLDTYGHVTAINSKNIGGQSGTPTIVNDITSISTSGCSFTINFTRNGSTTSKGATLSCGGGGS